MPCYIIIITEKYAKCHILYRFLVVNKKRFIFFYTLKSLQMTIEFKGSIRYIWSYIITGEININVLMHGINFVLLLMCLNYMCNCANEY